MKLAEVINEFRAVAYGGIDLGAATYIDLGRYGHKLAPELIGPGELVIIFSGVTSVKCPSTVNSAEEIIKKIAIQEGIAPNQRTFYDLETEKGGYKFYGEKNYSLNKLKLVEEMGKIRVDAWHEIQEVPSDLMIVIRCLVV